MSPQLILALWRERWGKQNAGGAVLPYVEGFLHTWGKNVVTSGFWTFPLTNALTAAVCCILFVLALTIVLPQGSQIALSVFLLGWALFARRFNGAFFALVVVSLSVLVSLRYFYWRFTASLGASFDLDFALGLVLCVAEIHLWVLTLLGYTSTLLPLTQAALPLPDDATVWPTVDVFIACHDHPHAQVVAAVEAAQAMDWSGKKCHIILLDRLTQEGFKDVALTLGVAYIACPAHAHDLNGQINHALQETHGKLIAIVDSGVQVDSQLLLACVGWFVRDAQLAMLQTPVHFLSPNPSDEALALCGDTAALGSCALLRRSALIEAGGLPTEPASTRAHLALTFQELGYRHAYVGVNATLDAKASNAPSVPANDLLQRIFRLPSPFLGQTLRWKLRLASLFAAVRFYYPLSQWVFFLAPAVYFLARIPLVHASSFDLTTYALPHLLHMFLATERIQSPRRTPLPLLLRETLLAWYILLCTSLCWVKAGVAKAFGSFRADTRPKNHAANEAATVPYLALAGLNVFALCVGALHGISSGLDWQATSSFFALWAIYWILISAALLSVAQETRHIQKYRLEQLRTPVMLKLSSGRSIYCVTENFPQNRLALVLPTPLAIEVGTLVQVSIFRGIRESIFTAQVLAHEGTQLQVQIEDTAQNEYRDLGIASQSRGENWPKWLPGQDADHPLPRWLTQFSSVLSNKILSGVDGLFKKWKL